MKKLFLASISFFILSGCNNHNSLQRNNTQQLVKVKNSHIQDTDRKTGQEISKRLVGLATSIPYVNDATAVVLGKFAIVGIDVNSKIDRTAVGSIKYSVAEALKKDPYGAQAIVVADPDTAQRLRDISAEIKNGRPVTGIMDELAEIAGRLMPEVPGNIVTPTPKNGVENQKKRLPADEKNNLDKIQKEHSNDKENSFIGEPLRANTDA